MTTLSQNGYPAGQFVSVAIDDNGRVVVSYDNGQQVEPFEFDLDVSRLAPAVGA